MLVVALVEDEVPVLVERPVLPADPVDAGDVVADVAGRAPVARLDLVLLGVQVLLRARDGGVLAELVAAVDPVERTRGSPPARAASGTRAGPPCWRMGGRMSGVFVKKFPRKYSAISPRVSSVRYSISSCLKFRQVKYV